MAWTLKKPFHAIKHSDHYTTHSRDATLSTAATVFSHVYPFCSTYDFVCIIVISLILQSLAVEDADQKVIHQLLEFAHRKALLVKVVRKMRLPA